jgi:Ni2+-binding GTPase involved in maturation of urease and hydrogenase
MRLITFAGPSGSGKTAVIVKVAEILQNEGNGVGVVKFDCISAQDDKHYRKHGIPVLSGISANLCPDHYFVVNIEACVEWALKHDVKHDVGFLISESAGLCNRCSPHIKGICAVCVIDCLSGVWTPKKAGPLLMFADIVVITKSDIVSQAEREVFAYRVRQANRKAVILFVNGLTGQGAAALAARLKSAPPIPDEGITHKQMRFPLPLALCSYCMGETRIGEDYVTASSILRRIEIPEDGAVREWTFEDSRDENHE